jgi:hypothetical protein
VTQFDEVFMAGGRRLNVHRREYCEGRHCSIHNPSDHPLKDAPRIWRSDKGMMERRCKDGIDHPDPDDLAFKRRTGHHNVRVLAEHGCDGCCRPPRKPIQVTFVKREIPKKPLLLPVVRWLDGGWGSFIRQVLGLQALIEFVFLLLGASGFGSINFIMMLFGGAFYCGTFSLIHSYKHHHSQYFRRSNR